MNENPISIDLNAPLEAPVAQPITGVQDLPDRPAMVTIRAIDWLRPDHAMLRGMAMSHTPQPYEERYAHQGKREMMRRVRQMRAGIIKP